MRIHLANEDITMPPGNHISLIYHTVNDHTNNQQLDNNRITGAILLSNANQENQHQEADRQEGNTLSESNAANATIALPVQRALQLVALQRQTPELVIFAMPETD